MSNDSFSERLEVVEYRVNDMEESVRTLKTNIKDIREEVRDLARNVSSIGWRISWLVVPIVLAPTLSSWITKVLGG